MPTMALDYMTEEYVEKCHAKTIQESWKPAIGDYWTYCCNLDVTQIQSQEDLDDKLEEIRENLIEFSGLSAKWIPTKEQAAQHGFDL